MPHLLILTFMFALYYSHSQIEAYGINKPPKGAPLTVSLPGVLAEQREEWNSMPIFGELGKMGCLGVEGFIHHWQFCDRTPCASLGESRCHWRSRMCTWLSCTWKTGATIHSWPQNLCWTILHWHTSFSNMGGSWRWSQIVKVDRLSGGKQSL